MIDKRMELYNAKEFGNIREVIKNAVKEHPDNNAFILKETNGKDVEYKNITYTKFDKQIDKQIVELGRLEKGVAAITQSDWLEPVLCKVDKYKSVGWPKPKAQFLVSNPQDKPTEETLLDFIMNKEIYRRSDRVDIQRLWERIVQSRLDTTVKRDFIEYITAEGEKAVESLRALVYDFFRAEKAIQASKECKDIENWSSRVVELLEPSLKGYTQRQINLVLALIVYEQAERDISYRELFCRFTELYWKKGGVV